jgi:cysteine desulfurase
MAVNNEVGSITDLAAVSELVRERSPDALLHTDAVQAALWLDLRSITPLVDLMSLSAHKFGGPKGVGVLTVRDGVRLAPIIMGGGQERDRRSGTHNVAGIVALAEALSITDAERDRENDRLGALRDRLVDGITAQLDGVRETVPRDAKVAGSAHVCIAGVESEALLYLLDEAEVCASSASACASGAMEQSHVLAAMGVDREWALGALRMSLGYTSTAADVDRAVDVIVDSVARLRRAASRPAASRPAASHPARAR